MRDNVDLLKRHGSVNGHHTSDANRRQFLAASTGRRAIFAFESQPRHKWRFQRRRDLRIRSREPGRVDTPNVLFVNAHVLATACSHFESGTGLHFLQRRPVTTPTAIGFSDSIQTHLNAGLPPDVGPLFDFWVEISVTPSRGSRGASISNFFRHSHTTTKIN